MSKKSFCPRSETSTRCRPGNGPLGLVNIWSRLLKHNWWDPLYGRVRIHSDVFFDFTFNENSFLYDYINRASPEFQLMHVYDQQLCSLFHRCGSPPLFLNSWRWIVPKSSNEIDHHRLLSGPKENQNTIEKNEFYEWKIWRTIMRIMSENSSICIKINSWFRRAPSASLPIIGPVQVNFFNSWPPPWFDQIRSNEGSVNTPFYHRFHTDQHFNSWSFEINGNFASTPSYYRFIQVNIWFFFSWNNSPKTTSYEGFWWFSYRKIFSPIFFFMRLNFEFISFHPLLYSMIGDQFLIIFIDETELLEEVVIDDRVIWKILKSCCI